MMASVSENVFFLRLDSREGKILGFLDYLKNYDFPLLAGFIGYCK